MSDLVGNLKDRFSCIMLKLSLNKSNSSFLFHYRANITSNVEHLNEMDSDLKQTMSRVQDGNNRIAALELGVKVLKTKAEQLRNNASDIQSKDVEGKWDLMCSF